MDMPRLLIADSNNEFRQILFDTLCVEYHVKTCSDGLEALELLRAFQPDILVLDLMLPGLDGISLLQRVSDEGILPAVLAMSTFHSSYVTGALQQLGVPYLMTKPCDLTAITDRLSDYRAALRPKAIATADLSTAVSNLLLALGFPTRLDGFLFLQAGIPMYLRDPSQSMTKELYVAIGQLFGKDGRQVERSIRSAIDIAWRNRDDRIWQMYFATPDGIVPRPSNNEFFGRTATALSRQGYSCKSA